MAETRWVRQSIRIGVVEFRRSMRTLRGSTARLFFLGGVSIVWSLMLLGFSVLFANSLRSIPRPILLPSSMRGAVGLYWLFDVFMVGNRVISQHSRIDSEEVVLTAVSARTAASGLVVAEIFRILAYLAAPTIIISGLFVYAFQTPASVVFVPLAVVLFVVSSVVVAYACGFAGAFLLSRSRIVARYKTPIGISLIVLFFGGYSVLQYAPTIDMGIDSGVLAWLPISWYGDLAVVGTAISQSWMRVGGVLITTAIILLGGGYAVERITSAFWFDAPIAPSSEKKSTARKTPMHSFWHPSDLDAPTRSVAQVMLTRTWRNPSRISFALLPIFIAGSVLINASQFGLLFVVAPLIAAIVIPWTAGLLFGLNPLGDAGGVLPTVLTTRLTGIQFITGLTIPGRVIGLSATVVLTLATGVVSPYSLIERGGLLLLGITVVFLSVRLAPLVGLWFPRFSAISVGQRRTVVPPSITAVVVHSLVTLGLAIPAATALLAPAGVRTALRLLVSGLVPVFLTQLAAAGMPVASGIALFQSFGATIGSIPTQWIQLVGLGGPVVIAIVVADRSVRYAARRFETYTIQ
ncbi:hypothetical protein [Halocatena marina]|uniref:hypothetical protein n=1 Tax=Halocatena marina TaxID=2934937 RepID=UPI0022246E83|nr:hypothetical protein [Halocatena marina]